MVNKRTALKNVNDLVSKTVTVISGTTSEVLFNNLNNRKNENTYY